MRMAAIYARVSSEQQREAHTIASQTAALIELAQTLDLDVPKAWIFEDEGYSGATLERPGLERCAIWRPKDTFRPSSSTVRIA
jgi:site-specific DNA recombinase